MSAPPKSLFIVLTRETSKDEWRPWSVHQKRDDARTAMRGIRDASRTQVKVKTYYIRVEPAPIVQFLREMHDLNGKGWHFTRQRDRSVSQGFSTRSAAEEAQKSDSLEWG